MKEIKKLEKLMENPNVSDKAKEILQSKIKALKNSKTIKKHGNAQNTSI